MFDETSKNIFLNKEKYTLQENLLSITDKIVFLVACLNQI